MKDFKITQTSNANGVKIVVIGVGGAGSALIDNLVNSDLADKVKLAVIDENKETLNKSKASYKLKLNVKWPRGLDGISPRLYKDAALKQYDDIKNLIVK
jgi:cell division protein FtsZ